MILEKGKEYYLTYPKLEFTRADNVIVEYRFEIVIIIPSDYDYMYPIDPYIIKYRLESEIDNSFNFIRYCDKPKVTGKNKWKFVESLNCNLRICELPYSIDCSLNTHEHPSKRRWFLHKHFGLESSQYTQIDWSRWTEFPLMFEDNEITLYYRLICYIVKAENPQLKNYTLLKKKVAECFKHNKHYKISDDILDEYNTNYLRDLLKLW